MDILDNFSEYVLTSDEFTKIKNDVLQPINNFVAKANSLQEMKDGIYELYPKIPYKARKEMVTRMMLCAHAYGFAKAANE